MNGWRILWHGAYLFIVWAVAALAIGLVLATVASGQCPPGNACPGGVCPTNQSRMMPNMQEWYRPPEQTAAQAKPFRGVVQVLSTRGGTTKHGTGSIVSIKGGTTTIVSCAHILAAGYQPRIVYADGQTVPAKIVSTDALNDTSVLRAKAVASARYLDIDAPPAIGATVSWCGYSSRGFVSGTARVLGYTGESLVISGRCPEGTSGGPVYTSRGMVATISECSQPPGGVWRTQGACSVVLRRILRRPIVVDIDVATLPLPDPCEPAETIENPVVEDTQCAVADRLDKIERILSDLVNNPQPSPPGPAGPQGAPGKDGKAGPIGPRGPAGKNAELQPIDLDDLAAAVLEKLPPIHVQLIRDGKIIKTQDVFLGGTLPLNFKELSQ